MRRVVITGMGIVSCLGNDTDSVTRSLREGRSGIRFKEDYKELGMRSHVAGTPEIALDDFIDHVVQRFGMLVERGHRWQDGHTDLAESQQILEVNWG